MRISDVSSDVCSSDLDARRIGEDQRGEGGGGRNDGERHGGGNVTARRAVEREMGGKTSIRPDRGPGKKRGCRHRRQHSEAYRERDGNLHIGLDRKSVVEGKRVSVRVDLGCRRIIKQKNKYKNNKRKIHT